MRSIALWLVVAALSSPAVAAGRQNVALVAFGDTAKELAGEARAVIARVDGVSLVAANTTLDGLNAAADAGVVCGPEADACLAKLTSFLKVQRVIALGAQATPAGTELLVVVVDAKLARRVGSARLVLPEDDMRKVAIEDALLLAVAPEKHFGQLVVTAAPAGASVRVDGTLVGTARPTLAIPLRAGRHEILVEGVGRTPYRESVDVRAGQTHDVNARLSRTDGAPDDADGTLTNGPRDGASGDDPASAVAGSPAPVALPPDTQGPGLFLAGLVAAGTGGAIVVVAGTTAITLDALLSSGGSGDASQRAALLDVERAAAVVALAGAAVTIGGGVACALALSGEGPADANASGD